MLLLRDKYVIKKITIYYYMYLNTWCNSFLQNLLKSFKYQCN